MAGKELQLGINIESTGDPSGFQQIEEAQRRLQNQNRQLEQSFNDADAAIADYARQQDMAAQAADDYYYASLRMEQGVESLSREMTSLEKTAKSQGVELSELDQIFDEMVRGQERLGTQTKEVANEQEKLNLSYQTADAYMADFTQEYREQAQAASQLVMTKAEERRELEQSWAAYRRLSEEKAEAEAMTERLIRDFKDESEVVEELNRRLREHADRVQEINRANPDTSQYQAGGIVRSFERENYEQRRFDVDENRWQRRRAQMSDEYETRQQLNRAYQEQRQADRDASFAARRAQRDWDRRKQAITGYIEDGLFAATAAIGVFTKESVDAFTRFDSLTRQVATINSSAADDIGAFRTETRMLSKEMGVLPDIMAETLYQADSLGSKDIFADARLASQGAVAGYTEANTVLEATLKTANAFKEGMYTNEQIMDLFFNGVDRGAFTMEELAGGISEVTSVAGETGTRLEDIMAALVTMTKQGDDLNEAVGLSSLLLTQLGLVGTQAYNAFVEASGTTYREFIEEGGTLAEALQLLEDHSVATGKSMGELIAGDSPFYRDQQAARAALELTGHHLDTLREETEAASNAAGSMSDAYAIMAESTERDIVNIQVGMENVKLAFGEWVMGIGAVQAGFKAIPEAFNFLSGGHRPR